MDVKIRPAVSKDVEVIASFSRKLNAYLESITEEKYSTNLSDYEHFVGRFLNSPEACVLVAEVDGKVVGHVIVSIKNLREWELEKREGYVEDLFVEDDFRNNGIGSMLLDAGVLWCKNNGLNLLSLNVSVKNETAFALYQSAGFKAHGFAMTKEL
ncbi:TPA: GNAT family N-acetyltransferase [Candidatus Micrarchaeota archaeon]|nr:GNAT family N-acetyltransferase [Candidatus Micrarchaeota archaeon]